MLPDLELLSQPLPGASGGQGLAPLGQAGEAGGVLTVSPMTVNSIRSGKPPEKIRDQSPIPSLPSIDVQEGQGILKKRERYGESLAGSPSVVKCQDLAPYSIF